MSKFKQGESGNPAGRPLGAVSKRTELSKLLLPHAEQIINKVIELALEGDINALRLCLERLIPRLNSKSASINFPLPLPNSLSIETLLNSNTEIIKAITSGDLTAEDGQILSGLLETQHKIIVSSELEQRLKAIEQVLKERQNETQ